MMADTTWITLFPQEYIVSIIQDVLDCSQSLDRPSETVKRPEEVLTKQIWQRLCKMHRYRSGPIEPHIESWLPDLERRADIRFSCGQGIHTYFQVEAKRLFVNFPSGRRSLIDKYINEGMVRFIEGHYAPHQKNSAMLAYVYNSDVSKAQNEVRIQIDKHAEKLCLQTSFSESILPVTPSIYETHHDLIDKFFTLYHMFVHLE